MLAEQARASGRPEPIIEKMVEGRIRKYYEEVVLLEQVWVHDGESRVKAVLQKAGVKLAGFARFQLGEGIDRPEGPTSPPRWRRPRECNRGGGPGSIMRRKGQSSSTTRRPLPDPPPLRGRGRTLVAAGLSE